MDADTDRQGRWRLEWFALGAMLLLAVGQSQFVDPDVWHEMSLIRESLAQGALATEDTFAYTPTVSPIIHHEWGTGAVLYALTTTLGSAGLLLLKLLLTTGIVAGCMRAWRRRSTPFPCILALAPLGLFLSLYGFSTVRAQMFSLCFTVWLLVALESDRRGGRGWILPVLLMFVVWVNVHGGFVVGLLLFGLHALEQAVRRRPVRHLVAAWFAMALLTLVNPYGLDYLPFIWNAVRLDRPAIPEWFPVWHASPVNVAMFVMSLVVLLYALARTGPGSMPGLLLVLAGAYAGMSHQRHLSLYAVLWTCAAPGYLQGTPLGLALAAFCERRRRLVRGTAAALGLTCLVAAILNRPWEVTIPANPGDHPKITYPVGAVEHLAAVGFRGNLMVPFAAGAYVSWKLGPEVQVSVDGRYEVAYPPRDVQAIIDCYAGEPGWRELLQKDPTDAVLVPTRAPLADELPLIDEWTRNYRDDAFEIYLRTGLDFPSADRRGQVLAGRFP